MGGLSLLVIVYECAIVAAFCPSMGSNASGCYWVR